MEVNKEKIQEWLKNLPKEEKARRMFLIKKRQKQEAEEKEKKS